ncbi:MAG: glycosyltransferase [Candidatus Omnitrophota bacterium]
MKNIKEKISVIIPAYNEAGIIEGGLNETIRVFNNFGCKYEIIVVDDGSSDNTFQNILKVSSRHTNIIVKQLKHNRGKGRALKVGFRQSSGEYVVFLDADMELHPAQLQTFFDIMRLDEADVVIGSKRHPNSRLNYPLQRKIISSVYFFLIKIFFGLPIRDTQTGLKLFKYEVLKRVFPRILVKAFGYDLEILVNVHRLGYRIAEAPIVLDTQRYNRIGMDSIWITWRDTMAIWYRAYILRYYDRFDYRRRKRG